MGTAIVTIRVDGLPGPELVNALERWLESDMLASDLNDALDAEGLGIDLNDDDQDWSIAISDGSRRPQTTYGQEKIP